MPRTAKEILKKMHQGSDICYYISRSIAKLLNTHAHTDMYEHIAIILLFFYLLLAAFNVEGYALFRTFVPRNLMGFDAIIYAQ